MLKRLLMSAAVVSVPAVAALAATSRTDDGANPAIVAATPHFVQMPEIVVPIIDGDRIDGRLTFDVVIAAVDEPGSTRISAAAPELRAAAVMAGMEFARLEASALGPVDAQALAARLSTSIKRLDPAITAILVQKVRAGAG